MQHEERQYLDLMRRIIDTGVERPDRTNTGTRSIFGAQMRFDLSKGFPLFTTRFIGFRVAFEEMMFFLRGETDTKKLEEKNINIWKGNTSREFLNSRGLYDLNDGDMGKGYGWQMRHFGGGSVNPGFDQVQYLVDNIKANPNDRRHLMCYWNPEEVLHEAALPPCHYSYYVQVVGGKLNAGFTMRSSDVYLGLPTNVAAYAFLTMLLCKLTGYEPGDLVYFGFDCHLYSNQYEVVEEQLKREPKPFPKLAFKKGFATLDEALALTWDDVEIIGYEHCGKMKKVEMAV